jgi:hypothetical protein
LSEAETIKLVLSAQAERYVRSDAPVEVRRLAATGALPLEPAEIATVLFALLHDADLEVKTRAQRSLEQLPDSVASGVLTSPAHPALLGWLAQLWRDRATASDCSRSTPPRTTAAMRSWPACPTGA